MTHSCHRPYTPTYIVGFFISLFILLLINLILTIWILSRSYLPLPSIVEPITPRVYPLGTQYIL